MSGYQFAPLRQAEEYLKTPADPASEDSSVFSYSYSLGAGQMLHINAFQPCENEGIFKAVADLNGQNHHQLCPGMNSDVSGSGIDVMWYGRLIESPADFQLSSDKYQIPEPETAVYSVHCSKLPNLAPCREKFEMPGGKPYEMRMYSMIAIIVLLFLILLILCSK